MMFTIIAIGKRLKTFSEKYPGKTPKNYFRSNECRFSLHGNIQLIYYIYSEHQAPNWSSKLYLNNFLAKKSQTPMYRVYHSCVLRRIIGKQIHALCLKPFSDRAVNSCYIYVNHGGSLCM